MCTYIEVKNEPLKIPPMTIKGTIRNIIAQYTNGHVKITVLPLDAG